MPMALRIARIVRAARVAALILVAGGAALASEMAPAVIPTTPGLTYKMYDSGHFSRFSSDTQFAYVLGGLTVTAGTPAFGQTLDLPGGAAVEEITFFFVDNGPETITFSFTSVPADALAGTLHGGADTTGIETDGILSATMSGSPLTTIDNSQRLYRIEMDLPAGVVRVPPSRGARRLPPPGQHPARDADLQRRSRRRLRVPVHRSPRRLGNHRRLRRRQLLPGRHSDTPPDGRVPRQGAGVVVSVIWVGPLTPTLSRRERE